MEGNCARALRRICLWSLSPRRAGMCRPIRGSATISPASCEEGECIYLARLKSKGTAPIRDAVVPARRHKARNLNQFGPSVVVVVAVSVKNSSGEQASASNRESVASSSSSVPAVLCISTSSLSVAADGFVLLGGGASGLADDGAGEGGGSSGDGCWLGAPRPSDRTAVARARSFASTSARFLARALLLGSAATGDAGVVCSCCCCS